MCDSLLLMVAPRPGVSVTLLTTCADRRAVRQRIVELAGTVVAVDLACGTSLPPTTGRRPCPGGRGRASRSASSAAGRPGTSNCVLPSPPSGMLAWADDEPVVAAEARRRWPARSPGRPRPGTRRCASRPDRRRVEDAQRRPQRLQLFVRRPGSRRAAPSARGWPEEAAVPGPASAAWAGDRRRRRRWQWRRRAPGRPQDIGSSRSLSSSKMLYWHVGRSARFR